MIMGCLANRCRAGWGSWLEVIERIPFFAAEETQPKIIMPSIWEPNFVRLLHEVDGIFDNSAKDLSCGALYFCDLRNVERQWFKEKIMQQPEIHTKTADMGSLCFYK